MSPGSGRPRVLVVTTNFPLQRRGDVTGNFVYDPVHALADDVEFTVLAPLDTELAPRRERFAGRIEVHRFAYWWPRGSQRLAYGSAHGIPGNLAASKLAWLQLPALVVALLVHTIRLARDVDVIHAHWLPIAAIAWVAATIHRKPLMVTTHGTDVTRFPDAFVGWAARRCDVVVSAHDDLLAEIERLAPTVRRERIRHLVEAQPVTEAERAEIARRLGEGPVVLYLSRLSPERDPITFVRAAPQVAADHPDVRFALVGNGPQRDEVEAEVDRLGISELAPRFGHRADVWTFLARADVFCAISPRNNAWTTVLIEAMTAGVPVVATTAGATADALTHEVDALLIESHDVGGLAASVDRLLRDGALGERLAAGARDTLHREGFDPEVVKQRTLDLYRELAA